MSSTETSPRPKDIAAEKGMVNVQIDGHWIQVPRGTRMIEACKIAEKEVPHYCYHPKLSSPGNCRMCMVQMGMPPRPAPGADPAYQDDGYQEISWMPRPVIACANTVAENMGIRTNTDAIKKSRENVLEFLLINHPLDCPICDKAGECRLQEFSVEHGQGESRFKEDKVKKPKNVKIGPRITLDDERCIMCSRCIRFMDEVAHEPVLGFSDRGTHTTVGVYPGRELSNNYGLNTVDLCPVGALTSNDFRFKMRTWFLKETPSIDTHCGTGTNISIWTRGNKIFRITPRQNDDVNSCWMPDSHRLSYSCPTDETRLTAPLIKADGIHEETCWNQSIRGAADALKQFDPSEIAVIASGRQTNEELLMMRTLAAELETEQIGIVSRLQESDDMLISSDRNPNTTGAKLVLASDDPGASLCHILGNIRDGKTKALVVASEDLLEAASFTEDDLRALELLIVIDHQTSATAQAADMVLPGAAPAEKRGSMVNVTGRLQKLNAACVPPGDARSDWEIITDLILALSGDAPHEGPGSIDAVFETLANTVDEFQEIKLASIPDLGQVITETGVTIPLVERENQRRANGEIVG
ncbi:molybdopterin-dependent oxidoreductase [Verrucomicrobiaceae bacterium N1E253]|uniref:Molybdopterin-dependent oxidoreductase n=1 Tax=Oceaniferula marina TaxID=2748318 RepID=A0A851GA28_9BACT|nr:molybdopterin-dependent oxidoreductase [Oceaniferula marina]NWK54069.1 molybdopterin-dependent oxidoreductase [Oceaniferula marina]